MQVVMSNEKILIRVQKYASNLLHHRSLLFEKERIILGLNSNIFCGPELEVPLGVFEKKQDIMLKSHHNFLEQIFIRMKTREKKKTDKHIGIVTQYFLGEKDISDDFDVLVTVKQLLSESCSWNGWIAQKAVLVKIVLRDGQFYLRVSQLVDNKIISVQDTPLLLAKCKKIGKADNDGEIYDCLIESYGLVRLLVGKNSQ